MDARQCCPESTLSELHERAGELPPSACPVVSKQHHCYHLQCPAKHQNRRVKIDR